MCCVDGSRLYEVNMWMWRFGRGMPRSMSVSDAERLRAEYKSKRRSIGEKSKGGMGREGDRTERPCEPGPVQPWPMGRKGEGVGVLPPLRTPQRAPSSHCGSGVLRAPTSGPRGHVLATGPNSVRMFFTSFEFVFKRSEKHTKHIRNNFVSYVFRMFFKHIS